MALRVGSVGLGLEASGPIPDWPWLSFWWAMVGLGRNCSWIGPALLARAIRQAINNQLRTGTDKGNPTV